MIKIGLCGSHRTGKTTLANEFSCRHDITFLPSVAGDVFNRHDLDPAKPFKSFDHRLDIQTEILTDSVELWSSHESFITDRTPIDFIAYTLADAQSNTVVDSKKLNKYLNDCFAASCQFNFIVLVQPAINLVAEKGKGAINEAYIHHLNYLMLGALRDASVSNDFVMPESVRSIKDRVNYLELIGNVR